MNTRGDGVKKGVIAIFVVVVLIIFGNAFQDDTDRTTYHSDYSNSSGSYHSKDTCIEPGCSRSRASGSNYCYGHKREEGSASSLPTKAPYSPDTKEHYNNYYSSSSSKQNKEYQSNDTTDDNGYNSYDKGYEDAYDEEDYDWERYQSDPDYANGVDDGIEDYEEEYGEEW